MKNEKSGILLTVLTSFLVLLVFVSIRMSGDWPGTERERVTAGFIYVGDESTPYTANFMRAAEDLRTRYGSRIRILERFNVAYDDPSTVIRELAEEKCDIIFANSYGYGEAMKKMAEQYPKIQFCQATCEDANLEPVLSNYHNFMGEIYEGVYVTGCVAGRKLQEMIDEGTIGEDEAILGYVGAFPVAEVISGYTAFFLGARTECPSARMKVAYTGTWSNYMQEVDCAEKLIEGGCVVICQDTDTTGPAVACENAERPYPVIHVSYNQDMISVAPTTSLTGCRINWSPYICSAVDAVFRDIPIEENMEAHINGNDAGAGFSGGWVEMLELNRVIAPKGGEQLIRETIEAFEKGKVHVFQGEYSGKDPLDPLDTIDLRTEYKENSKGSAPAFHYVLDDVIEVME